MASYSPGTGSGILWTSGEPSPPQNFNDLLTNKVVKNREGGHEQPARDIRVLTLLTIEFAD